METGESGAVTFKEYEDFKNDQKEKEKIRKEAQILREEIRSKKEYLKILESSLNDDMQIYRFSEPAVRKHKYWATSDYLYIAEIKEVVSPSYVRYLVSTPDEVNSLHSSSTLGVLWNYPVPITQEKYDELMMFMLPEEEYIRQINKNKK